MPLRVAIDARSLTERYTSNRTYWENLVRGLCARSGPELDVILFTRNSKIDCDIEGASWKVVQVEAANDRIWSWFTFPAAASREGATLAHTQYTTSPRFRIPTVTTIHDVSYFVEPSWFRFRDRFLLHLTVPGSCRRAAKVITVSEASRQEIVKYIGVDPAKVVVTPLGVHPVKLGDPNEAAAKVAKRFGLPQPYVLSVGTLNPRKNWPLAILSVAGARSQGIGDLKLAFTGPQVSPKAKIDAVIAASDGAEWVRLLGGVSSAELSDLYQSAFAVLLPSLHEGFGLSPLEAFVHEAPVVASTRGAIPEVCEDAAILLPPENPTSWTAALLRLLEDSEREKLIERGLARASVFDWETTVDKTLEAYRVAVGSS